MIKWTLIGMFWAAPVVMHAQKAGISIAGEYYLSGVMETASGFKLNSDSTFQFFYSYGALDRTGEGKWALKNNQLILNSRKYPGKDFVMKSNKTVEGHFITIRISDNNPQLLPFVYCGLIHGNNLTELVNNKEGLIRFPRQPADSILLIVEFCPERSSSFAISNTTSNYFEFGFEPWLMEVFFRDFMLNRTESELWGKHPVMDGPNFHYKKTD